MEQNSISLQINRIQSNHEMSFIRRKCLFTALIANIRTGYFINSLATGFEKDKLHQLLSNIPQLKQESSIVEMLNFLRNEGERTAYSILLPYLISTDEPKKAETIIRKRFLGIELFVRRAHHIYLFLDYIQSQGKISIKKKDLEYGILAWDMGELIILARIAYELGYIDETAAWEHIEYAGKQCFQSFKTWEEIGKSYLIGQAMKTDNKEELQISIECFILATNSKNSPWNRNHFLRSTTYSK